MEINGRMTYSQPLSGTGKVYSVQKTMKEYLFLQIACLAKLPRESLRINRGKQIAGR